VSGWIRFEAVRGHRNSEYGTITQDGRLCIGNALARQTGITPGTHVEIYYQPDTRKIGIMPIPSGTPYSLKVGSTGMVDGRFDIPNKRGSMPIATIYLKSFLHSRHIGLASKIRGELYWDEVDRMLIFEIPKEPVAVAPSEHFGKQLENGSWPERVAGDIGE
jgi:hypothetical protein